MKENGFCGGLCLATVRGGGCEVGFRFLPETLAEEKQRPMVSVSGPYAKRTFSLRIFVALMNRK